MIQFLKKSTKIICTSNKYLNSSNILKKFKQKVEVIPVGIEHKKVKRNNKKKVDKEYFIFVGNFRSYKGIEFLIKVFIKNKINLKIISSEKISENSKLIFNNYRNIKLYEKINEREKTKLIKESIGLILPSIDRREAYGLVLLEAASQKIPLISTEINTGSSFININKKTGLTFKPGNVRQLNNFIMTIKNNKKIRRYFGLNAYARYKKVFTLEKMIKKYVNFYSYKVNN
jgi:rhamnosyl/mannosyltransferase